MQGAGTRSGTGPLLTPRAAPRAPWSRPWSNRMPPRSVSGFGVRQAAGGALPATGP